MYSAKSYQLTEKEYNYLIPVLRAKLLCRNDKYYFIGTFDELCDMIDRVKGVHDYYNEIPPMIIYECAKNGNLAPFRNEIKATELQINN